jgi:predicted RNase H-like nuclease (RuvC/YqgF family)
MARIQTSSATNTVSLFPFLSILACVIGALTLIISSLSLSQVSAGRENKDIARAEDYVALQNTLAARREEIATLQEEAERDNAELARMRELQAEEQALRSRVEALQQTREQRLALAAEAEARQAAIDNLTAGGQALAEEIAAAEKELAGLEKDASAEQRVQILPSRGTSRIAPSFVEVAKDGLVLHTRSRSIAVARGAIASDANLKKLVDATLRAERGTLVLLLRPDGYPTYSAFRGIARQKGWPYAKLPLLTAGPVDLKLFNIER